jgi:hypothetical protein
MFTNFFDSKVFNKGSVRPMVLILVVVTIVLLVVSLLTIKTTDSIPTSNLNVVDVENNSKPAVFSDDWQIIRVYKVIDIRTFKGKKGYLVQSNEFAFILDENAKEEVDFIVIWKNKYHQSFFEPLPKGVTRPVSTEVVPPRQ